MSSRTLVQIAKREGRIDRVKPGVTPVLELLLDPQHRVLSVEMHPVVLYSGDRKTVDWVWTAYIIFEPGLSGTPVQAPRPPRVPRRLARMETK